MKACQFAPSCRQQILAFGLAQKRQGLVTDHASVHDPDPLRRPETLLHLGDHFVDGLHILGIAGQGVMGQRESFAGHDQGQDYLFAVTAMVAGVATLGQVIVLGKALEVGAGQVIQQQVVVQAEEDAELLLEVVLDRLLGFQQIVEGAVQPVLGDFAVGYAEQVFEARGCVPPFRQGELAARAAQAVDDLDGHDVRRADGVFALRHMACDDVVEFEEPP